MRLGHGALFTPKNPLPSGLFLVSWTTMVGQLLHAITKDRNRQGKDT
jgi:hypothetical protein